MRSTRTRLRRRRSSPAACMSRSDRRGPRRSTRKRARCSGSGATSSATTFAAPGRRRSSSATCCIMHFDGSDQQYVVALDKNTGKTVWKTARSIDFQGSRPGRQAAGRRRLSQSLRDAARDDGGREAAAHQPGRQSDLRIRPAHGQGALAHRRAEKPLGEHGPGGRTRDGVLPERLRRQSAHGRAAWTARATSPRTHVVWRVGRGVPQKPSVLLVGDLDLHDQRRRHREHGGRAARARSSGRRASAAATRPHRFRPAAASTSSARKARPRCSMPAASSKSSPRIIWTTGSWRRRRSPVRRCSSAHARISTESSSKRRLMRRARP